MTLTLSLIIGFVLCGVSQVITDLRSDHISGPMWVLQPTIGRAVYAAATWFVRPLKTYTANASKARAVAFALLGVIEEMAVATGLVWLSITGAISLFRNSLLQVVGSIVLIIVGSLIVLPLANLIMIPLIFILAWPLDLIFPLRDKAGTPTNTCCPSCGHYLKRSDWQYDLVKGLWQAAEIPQSDKLPCGVVEETVDTWQRYFSREPRSRGSFPCDCQHFERRR